MTLFDQLVIQFVATAVVDVNQKVAAAMRFE